MEEHEMKLNCSITVYGDFMFNHQSSMLMDKIYEKIKDPSNTSILIRGDFPTKPYEIITIKIQNEEQDWFFNNNYEFINHSQHIKNKIQIWKDMK
jgi:hypothetical protein